MYLVTTCVIQGGHVLRFPWTSDHTRDLRGATRHLRLSLLQDQVKFDLIKVNKFF